MYKSVPTGCKHVEKTWQCNKSYGVEKKRESGNHVKQVTLLQDLRNLSENVKDLKEFPYLC